MQSRKCMIVSGNNTATRFILESRFVDRVLSIINLTDNIVIGGDFYFIKKNPDGFTWLTFDHPLEKSKKYKINFSTIDNKIYNEATISA